MRCRCRRGRNLRETAVVDRGFRVGKGAGECGRARDRARTWESS